MFKSFKKNTLRNLSYDSDKDQYMTDSVFKAIDGDALVRNYTFSFGSSSNGLASNDAFIVLNNEEFVLIEFKNGNFSGGRSSRKKIKDEVRLKIAENLWVLNDILKQDLAFDRLHINYILVYNDEAVSRETARTLLAKKAGEIIPENVCKIFFHRAEFLTKKQFEIVAKKFENGTYKF